MLIEPMDILKLHPIRKTKRQKEAFRSDLMTYAKELDYECTLESGSFHLQNIVIGNPKTAKYLLTAHYDTPASIGLPNVLTPCNLLTYILWQILLVGGLMLVSVGAAFAVLWLTKSKPLALAAWYVIYFSMLVLLMVGPANKSNANDNTSGVVSVLEIARTLPENLRNRVCFVLFDLEEAGLLGSAVYRKTHKAETDNQIILNLDCVGDGDHIIFFPTKKAKKEATLIDDIDRICGKFGQKSIELKKDGFYTYPSDQKNFPVGIGVAAFQKKKIVGYYVAKIHTRKDTILEETNVNLLRAAITTIIGDDAVN